ncbi:MAG: YidC/Oxa1 family membrane protein insertase [Armatimonadota bacterium]|nr:YidC/Oxa1 family membrane protein insertase [Armatimonadota bacterium]
MNNRQNMIFMMVMMLAILLLTRLIFPQPQQQKNVKKPDPVKLLEKADKQVKEGNYKDAFGGFLHPGTYDQVASNKAFQGTKYGAEALMRKAEAMRTAKGKFRNERGAIDIYKTVTKQYSDSEDPNIQEYVSAAEREREALWKQIDKKQSSQSLYKIVDTMVKSGKSLGLGRYSYAFALLMITLIIKALTWKLSAIQYKGMRDMQRVQPLVKEIQGKYKGKPQEVNAKVMETYKKEGVNPLMGCLPMLVQFPILIFVYKAILQYEYQFQNGVFLWIGSGLHHKFSFIGANLAQPDIPLVILYTISMFITQRLTVVDATQAEQQKIMSIMMPLMFAFFFWKFASAFLLYWLMLNIVMTAHQYYVMKAQPVAAVSKTVEAKPSTPTRPAQSRRKRRR